MKLPKLNEYFPVNNSMAELYGGWLEGPYFKINFRQKTRKENLINANLFLQENGFEIKVTDSDFNDENSFEVNSLSLHFNVLGPDCLLLIYEQPLMSQPMDSLIELFRLFRDERDWKQFHTPKNLAMALSSEAGELLDLMLWDRDKNPDVDKLSNEMADVFVYLLLLSKELNIDLLRSVIEKFKMNKEKYPVEKSKGTARKYNVL